MPKANPRSAAIQALHAHLGIGCIRTNGSPTALHTTWEWRGGGYVTIRISRSHGWYVAARNGNDGSWRMAEVSDPLADGGPSAADILAVARTACLLPPDLPGQLRPAEHMSTTVATAQVRRGENPGLNTTAMLLLTIERLTGQGDYLTGDDHGA
jgi:hypothetical protein